MKTIGMVIVLMLSMSAFAQDSVSCSTEYDTTICKFSSGRVNVTTFDGTNYNSIWYTPERWKEVKILYDTPAPALGEGAPVVLGPNATITPSKPVMPTLAPAPCEKKDKACQKAHKKQ